MAIDDVDRLVERVTAANERIVSDGCRELGEPIAAVALFELAAAGRTVEDWSSLVPAAEAQLGDEVSPTRIVVREVARRLNEVGRLDEIQRADGFVVYRAERWPELLEDLEASLPLAQLERLRGERRIPVSLDVLGRPTWR